MSEAPPIPATLTPEQLAAVLDALGDAVFTIRSDYTITQFNRSAERLTGFARGEVIGRRCYDVFRTRHCRRGCLMSQALHSGQELSGRQSMGTRQRGETDVALTAAPLRDAAGQVIGGVKVFRSAANGTAAEPDRAPPPARGRHLPILAAYERRAIEDVLERVGGSPIAAARELGISRTTLWRKMRRLGIPLRRRRNA